MYPEGGKKLRSFKPKRYSKRRSYKESALFGSPRMKMMREAMRQHVDVMETEKACAETMLSWVARDEMWSRQVDEHYGYRLFDEHLSAMRNKRRFAEYTKLQRDLHEWMAQDVEDMLRCYVAGKGDIALLTQMTIAAMKPPISEDGALRMIAPAGGVKVLDGKAVRGGVAEPANGDSQDPFDNPTLKLVMATFLEKAAIYRMPHPDLHIEGVPDEEEQATPRQQIKKTVREMLPESGKKIP